MSEGWSKHRTLNQRVARLIELEGSSQPMLNAVIPGQKREICQVIGKDVSLDRYTEIPIFEDAGLNVAIARCAPSKSTLHHDYKTNKIFTALAGK